MGFRVKNALVGIVKESTVGTFLEPSTGFPAFDVTYSVAGESFERTESRSWFGKLDSIPGPAKATLGFKILLQSGGIDADDIPYWSTALQACGFKLVTSASTNNTFTPVSTFNDTGGNPAASYSVCIWEDGTRYNVAGAFGSVKLTAEMGKPIIMEFTFEGAYSAYATDTMGTVVSVGTTGTPPTFLGAGVTIQGTTCIFETLEYDIQNTLGDLVDANSASGIKAVTIVDRRIMGRINPEMNAAGATDWLAKWRAATTGAISTGLLGTGAGNRIQITAPRTVLRAPSLGERNGQRIADIEFDVTSLLADAEGSDFTLVTS